jgi:zinc protease
VAPPPKEHKPVVLRSPNATVIALRVAFGSGSADDPAGKEGLTRLTAAMMAEGGTQSLTYAELVDRLYPLAATIDAHVDRDESVFEVTVPRAMLDRLYPLLRDVVLAPRFDAESFARLKARQTSSLTSDLRGANDEELGKEALQSMLYAGHPYGHPALGTERGLAAITLDDVKQQYTRAFCKDRLQIGVAGGFPEGFDATLAADLAKLPPCAAARAPLPPPADLHGGQLLVIDKASAGAAAISIGFTTPVTRADSRYPTLLFATDLLGLHRETQGRLFQEIRTKRGLNYGDYAYAEFYEQEGWTRVQRTNTVRREQFISMWLRPMKRPNASFALRAALRELGRVAGGAIDDAEVARWREYLSRLEGLQAQTESRRLGYAMDDDVYGLDAPYLEVLRKAWSTLDAAKLKAELPKILGSKDVAIAIVVADGQKFADEVTKAEPAATPVYDSPKSPEIQAEDKEIARQPLPVDAKSVRVVPIAEMFK